MLNKIHNLAWKSNLIPFWVIRLTRKLIERQEIKKQIYEDTNSKRN